MIISKKCFCDMKVIIVLFYYNDIAYSTKVILE